MDAAQGVIIVRTVARLPPSANAGHLMRILVTVSQLLQMLHHNHRCTGSGAAANCGNTCPISSCQDIESKNRGMNVIVTLSHLHELCTGEHFGNFNFLSGPGRDIASLRSRVLLQLRRHSQFSSAPLISAPVQNNLQLRKIFASPRSTAQSAAQQQQRVVS